MLIRLLVVSTLAASHVFTALAQAQPIPQDSHPDVLLGAGPGSGLARLISGADITELARGFPFGSDFLGGIRVAAGDLTGDGVADLITGQGEGGGRIRVIDGVTGADVLTVAPFGDDYTGGVFVGAGDLDGDGRADVLVGQGRGGLVAAYSGATRAELGRGAPFGSLFAGGVTVAAGDVNGDGRADVITGMALGGLVRVFDGIGPTELVSGFPYGPLFLGGVHVAAGDISGDGRAEIVVSPRGGGDVVFIFNPVTQAILPVRPNVGTSGIHVAVGDFDLDGKADLFTAAGAGGYPLVRLFSGADGHEIAAGYGFNESFRGGVFVATTAAATGTSFSSENAATFTVGEAGTFMVTTRGRPGPITQTGTLPGGVTFTDNGDGTAALAGTPAAGTGGTIALTFRAGVGGAVSQAFTLTVNEAPAVTSAATVTLTVGTAETFAITTTGHPDPTLTVSGTLPAGVAFTDNGDGTARLAGTPAAGTGGTYPLTITAANGIGTAATQAFSLIVNQAPAFTSAATTTFAVGAAGTFTITTSGNPAVTSLTRGGTVLPAGVTFTDHGDGTGTLAGTPAAGTDGEYALTFTADNGVGTPVVQTFTLAVTDTVAFTSADAATFGIGAANSFAVTTVGFPRPTLTRAGTALPDGVTFVDNGNGTATLAGTPAAGSGGTYAFTITASNGVSADVVQSFTLTVNDAPRFTSAATTTFATGTPGTFTVTTSGTPTVTTLTSTGALPGGVTFVDNGNGTATLAGTPTVGSGAAYTLTFTATNGVHAAVVQNFVLAVTEAPTIISANAATFPLEMPTTFTVTTTGFPEPSLTLGGATLPGGITFTDNGDGTGTLSGTPAAGSGGTYAVTFTAANGIGANAVQNFTLTVNAAPAITSAATTTFSVGTAGTFAVTTTGLPAPGLTVTGTLPPGVTFVDNGNGTATLSGTPAAGTGGSYPLTFTASNGVLPDGVQSFTLNVNQAPAITSPAGATFVAGTPGSFTVTTNGVPAPTLAIGGAGLPPGLTFADNGNGTGTLAGTPVAGTGGTYAVSFTATNPAGASAPQPFTLTVNQAPAFTSAASATFQVGVAGSFSVTTSGFPAITTITRGGAPLPGGITYTDNGNGTATLAGTAAVDTGASYALTFTIDNGVGGNVVQAFTLNVQQAPAITSANATTFTVGTAASFTVTSTGFPVSTVAPAGTLPAGVTFTPATNVLGGTPTETGAFPIQFTATNGVSPDAVQSFTLDVVCPAITVNPATIPDGLYQAAYGPVTFSQSGSTGSTFTWGATGLPAGLALSTSGVLSGTPADTMLSGAVVVTVTDNFGCTGTRNTTITVRPVADNENYLSGVGNTQYVVGVAPVPATPHVLNADVNNTNVKMGDNGPGPLSVTFPAASANGGAIAEGGTDGTFVYTPAAGFAGPTDSFVYTLTDGNGVTNTATVTINLSSLVWYVNSAGGNGDGRSHNPFNTLANAASPSAPNSFIYVHTGGATTSGNLALDANQTLHGAGTVFIVNGLTLAAGIRPTLTGTVTLANNTVVTGVNFTPAAAAMTANGLTGPVSINQVNVTGGTTALSLTGVSGMVTVDNAAFTNTSGAELLVSGGTGAITINQTVAISSNAGRSIDIQGRTAASGAVTISSPVTDTGSGIFLDNNDGTTITFRGGLSLSTGANSAFTATNGGTVQVCDENPCNPAATGGLVNTITTTTGTALNVAGTTIGTGNLEFRSISSNGGSSTGIIVDNTGTTGGLRVKGAGSAGSGGTIANKAGADGSTTTGIGIYLNQTANVLLSFMQLNDFDNFGIRGTNVTGFTLTSTTINALDASPLNGTTQGEGIGEGSIRFDNLMGTVAFTDSTITHGVYDNVGIFNTNTATALNFTASNTTFATTTALNTGNDALRFEIDDTIAGAPQVRATITIDNDCDFTAARGDLLDVIGQRTIVAGTAANAAIVDVTITGNDFSNNHSGIASGGGGFIVHGNGNVTFSIADNDAQDARGRAVNISKGATAGIFSGTIDNNRIGVTGITTSGSDESSGIYVDGGGAGSMIVAITNNVVRRTSEAGIFIVANNQTISGNNATVNVTATGNGIFEPHATLSFAGIWADIGTGVNSDASTACLDIGGGGSLGNDFSTGDPFNAGDINLSVQTASTLRLRDYGGTNNNDAQIASYLTGRNLNLGTTTVSLSHQGTMTTNVGACLVP